VAESQREMRQPKFSSPIRNISKSICAAGCCLLALPFAGELIHSLASSVRIHRQHNCEENARTISAALLLYSQDWDGTLPSANHWADAASLRIQHGEIDQYLHCPEALSPYSYVFNINLDRGRLADLEQAYSTPMLYEGRAMEFNAVGDSITVPIAYRHISHATIAYADGHLRSSTPSRVKELNWQNKSEPRNEASKH
jgi:prepilin-type processing-associated H-X9-DG protein